MIFLSVLIRAICVICGDNLHAFWRRRVCCLFDRHRDLDLSITSSSVLAPGTWISEDEYTQEIIVRRFHERQCIDCGRVEWKPTRLNVKTTWLPGEHPLKMQETIK